MREPGAMFNTHIRKSKGFVSTDPDLLGRKTDIDIRFTSDFHGETLSFACGSVQITVKYSDVEKLVEETRKDRGDLA